MGISASITTSKLEFTRKEEIEIDVPIPAKVISFTLTVEAKVKILNDNTSRNLQTVSASQIISFN